MAVLDFYQEHMSSGTHEAYFGNLPKHAKIMKGKVLAIELWIDLVRELLYAVVVFSLILNRMRRNHQAAQNGRLATVQADPMSRVPILPESVLVVSSLLNFRSVT